MKLSDKLRKWRIERPDEWTMDDFIREAEKLENDGANLADSLRRISASLELENYKLMEGGKDNPHITAASVALSHVMVALIKEAIHLKED